MSDSEIQPQELSTGRGNFMTVLIDLVSGQSHVLSDAEIACAAAEAARRQASRSGDLLMLSSGAL
jgi:hypothetical protein